MKAFLTRYLWTILLIVAFVAIAAVLVAYVVNVASPAAERSVDLSFLLSLSTLLPKWLGPQITTLVGLVVLQFLLAVALALVQNVFDLKKLSDFYRTRVLPMLVGWLGFVILAKLASAEILGPTYGVMAGDGVSWAAWLAVVASLGSRIVADVKTLYGELSPFKPSEQNGQ